MKLPLWHWHLESHCTVTEMLTQFSRSAAAELPSGRATGSGRVLARGCKEESPVSPCAAPILRNARHKENSALPEVQLISSLHLASSALLICPESQDLHSPLNSHLLAPTRDWQDLGHGHSLPRVLQWPVPWTSDWHLGAAVQARKAGLHSNSINARSATEEEGLQSHSQWSWEELPLRWDGAALGPTVHTQHDDRYSSVIQVTEQTKVSLQDETMNAATLFHLPWTKESRAQAN